MADIPKNKMGAVPVKWIPNRERWMLTTYEGGKKRRFFKRKADAETAWRKHVRAIDRHGKQAAEYDIHAHREYAEARRIAGGLDLREVARFYVAHHPTGGASLNVEDAVVDFLSAKRGRKVSARHVACLRTHLKSKFSAAFGSRKLRELRSNDVLAWLLELGTAYDPRTVSNYYKSLKNFFNWCWRRELIAVSPMKNIVDDDLPEIPAKAKGVLTVDQSAALMIWVDKESPEAAAWFALQLFAGIRNAEAGRFRWEWIDCEREVVDMPGWLFERTGHDGEASTKATRIVKTGDDWALHSLPANFWAWMRKYRKDSGAVAVPADRLVLRWRKQVFPKLATPIPSWPKNALRHTFCTMLMSLHGDAAKVANWSRHTSPHMLYQSYLAKLVSEAEARRFLSIVPAASVEESSAVELGAGSLNQSSGNP